MSEEIKNIIAEKKIDPNKKNDEINSILRKYIIDLMSPLEKSDFSNKLTKMLCLFLVNGVGKQYNWKIGMILKLMV